MTFLQTSTSAIPYLFPPSNCYLSFTPSLDFPPSLREFLHTCLNRDLDRCEAKDKRERKQIKISSLGTDTPSGPSLSRLRIFFFFFLLPPIPRWAVLQSCVEPVAISDCRRCSGLGWMPSCCRKNWWSGCCAHE